MSTIYAFENNKQVYKSIAHSTDNFVKISQKLHVIGELYADFFSVSRLRQKTHVRYDQSAKDAHSSMAYDPTSNVSIGPLAPDLFVSFGFFILYTVH